MQQFAECVKRVATSCSLMLIAGCASFEGTPHPVAPTDVSLSLAKSTIFSIEAAANVAKSAPDSGDNARAYRDAFLAVQMGAIDAQYFRFRRDLTAQAKVANFALDLGVLGLTSGGAIAGETAANALSAGGAALTGAKASLNKEVYFEKTLPAIVASMDARRLELKVAILAKMQKSIADYSLAQAIIDVSTYQLSASLDSAIEQITGDANAQKEEATRAYTNLVATCTHPEPDAVKVAIGIKNKLDTLDATADKTTLDAVAYAMHVPVIDSFAAEKDNIVSALGSYPCTLSAANALSSSLSTSTKGKIQ